MNQSIKAAAFGFVMLGTLVYRQPARADDPQPQATDSSLQCPQLMDKAQSSVAKMAAGVEKMAAQKELASAKSAMDKGDALGCKTHVKNAMEAMRSK